MSGYYSSWYEIMCFSVELILPGMEVTQDYVESFLGGVDSHAWQPTVPHYDDWKIADGKATEILVIIHDVQFASSNFESGAKWNLEQIGLADCFDTEDFKSLWGIIKPILDQKIADRESRLAKELTLFPSSTEKLLEPHKFGVPILVRVWADWDDYYKESDGGIEIVKHIDIKELAN